MPRRLPLQLRAAQAQSDSPVIPGEVFVVFRPRSGVGIASVSALNPATATPVAGGSSYAAVVPLKDGETVASGVARLSSVAGAPAVPFLLVEASANHVQCGGPAWSAGAAASAWQLQTERSLPAPLWHSACASVLALLPHQRILPVPLVVCPPYRREHRGAPGLGEGCGHCQHLAGHGKHRDRHRGRPDGASVLLALHGAPNGRPWLGL